MFVYSFLFVDLEKQRAKIKKKKKWLDGLSERISLFRRSPNFYIIFFLRDLFFLFLFLRRATPEIWNFFVRPPRPPSSNNLRIAVTCRRMHDVFLLHIQVRAGCYHVCVITMQKLLPKLNIYICI